MTKSELIKQLEIFPDDMEVYVPSFPYDSTYLPAYSVRETEWEIAGDGSIIDIIIIEDL